MTAGTGVDSCTISRQHGASVSFLSMIFTAIVYTDTNIAISQQKSAADDASANHYTTIPITGAGDEAFIAPYSVTSSNKDTNASYIAQVRDGNLRWTVTLSEIRSDGGKWTDNDRQQMLDDLAATVKATHKKLIS